MIYAWQTEQWGKIWQAKSLDRLPHALLLTGMSGVGKASFANHLSQALLCSQITGDGKVCNTCHSCHLIQGLSHPNVKWISPEKNGQAIKVDQIREVNEFVQQSSLSGEYRVVIINPAHSMNMSAANALLKTLEEPSTGAVIALITDHDGHLPATIRSRCQKILFPTPNETLALDWLSTQNIDNKMSASQWLRLSGGAPLLAVSMQEDEAMKIRDELYGALPQLLTNDESPLKLATKWQKTDPIKWLDLFHTWVSDLIRLQVGGDVSHLVNQDYATPIAQSAKRSSLAHNIKIADTLMKTTKQIGAGVNFNKQLLIENILIKWSEQKTCN